MSRPPSRATPATLQALLALSAMCAAAEANAEPAPVLDRISVWLGAYQADISGSLSANNAAGTLNTGEQPLFRGHDTVRRARVDWLLMDSQGFSVDYFRVHRSTSGAVSQPFDFNGTTYDLNASATAEATLDVGHVSYRWWFGGDDNVFGVGVGGAYYRVDTRLSAQASLPGATYLKVQETNKSTWAPLLTLGWRYRVSDAVRLYADLSGSRKQGSELSGNITNAALGAEWFPWHNVGVGAEYGQSHIRFTRNDNGDEAHLRLKLNGPALFLRMRF